MGGKALAGIRTDPSFPIIPCGLGFGAFTFCHKNPALVVQCIIEDYCSLNSSSSGLARSAGGSAEVAVFSFPRTFRAWKVKGLEAIYNYFSMRSGIVCLMSFVV